MGFLDDISVVQGKERMEALRERFKKNLDFFAKTDPNLHKKLLAKPTEYGLISDEHGVNIVSLSTRTLVFGLDDSGHTMARSCKNIAENPFSNTKWQKGYELNPFYMITSLHKTTAKAPIEIFRLAYEMGMDPDKIIFPSGYLPFAAFYGLGGGGTLAYICEQYEKLGHILIYEPTPDFFGISAYFVDYGLLYSKTAKVLIAVKELPDEGEIRDFFAKERFASLYPRLELTMYESDEIATLKDIVSIQAGSMFRGFGTYEDEMIGWRNSQKNCDYDLPKIPILTPVKHKITAPICVVGNGGSLDENISFLKQNIENMVIFSCGTAIRTLLKNGIKPDYQIEIERTDYLHEILAESWVDEVNLIAANVVDPKTLAVSKGKKYLFFRDFTASTYLNPPKKIVYFSSPFVGNAATAIALSLSDTVILCGIDVGYKKDRTIHSKESIYEESCELPKGSYAVRENFEGSEIYSNNLYNLSKTVLEWAIANSGAKVLNISDGAYISGAVPTKSVTLKKIDKQTAMSMLESNFSTDKNSIFTLQNCTDTEGELSMMLSNMSAIFYTPKQSKMEFFTALSLFESFLTEWESGGGVGFYLFNGSLKHIVFSLHVAVLGVSEERFGDFYKTASKMLMDGIKEMIKEFKANDAKGRVSSLLRTVTSV